MALPTWENAVRRDDCSLCPPRDRLASDWHFVGSLASSSVYLNRNQAFRGHVMVVFDARHETRLECLDSMEYSMLMEDVRRVASALVEVFAPDHVNYASLGNETPHLHWHVIPRYKSDPRWRKAIWAGGPEDAPVNRIQEPECEALAQTIRKRLR